VPPPIEAEKGEAKEFLQNPRCPCYFHYFILPTFQSTLCSCSNKANNGENWKLFSFLSPLFLSQNNSNTARAPLSPLPLASL